MKKLFIGSYQENKNNIYVINGLSFIDKKHFKNSKILFIKTYNYDFNEVNNLIKEYDEIYFSLILTKEFYEVLPLILLNPTKQFFIGGTFYRGFDTFIQNITDKIKHLTVIKTLAEKYFDNKDISLDYNFYAEDYFQDKFKDKDIWFTYNLNKNCYWNKCIFCIETCYFNKVSRNIETAIEVLKEDSKRFKNRLRFKIYSPELYANELKELLKMNSFLQEYETYIDINIRPEMYNIIKDINEDLSHYIFKIGTESFSERIINFFNKNFDMNENFKIVKEILLKNGSLYSSFIRNIPLTDEEMKQEEIMFKLIKHLINNKKTKKYTNIGFSDSLEFYECLTDKIYNQIEKFFKPYEYEIDKQLLFNVNDFTQDILDKFDIDLPIRYILKMKSEKQQRHEEKIRKILGLSNVNTEERFNFLT